MPIRLSQRRWISIVVDVPSRQVHLLDHEVSMYRFMPNSTRSQATRIENMKTKNRFYLEAFQWFLSEMFPAVVDEWASCVAYEDALTSVNRERHVGAMTAFHAYRATQEPRLSVKQLYESNYLTRHLTDRSTENLSKWMLLSVLQGAVWTRCRRYSQVPHNVIAPVAPDAAAGEDRHFCCLCQDLHLLTERRMVIHGARNIAGQGCGNYMCVDCWFSWRIGNCMYCRQGTSDFFDAETGDSVVHPSARPPIRRSRRRAEVRAQPGVGECMVCWDPLVGRRQVQHNSCGAVLCYACYMQNNRVEPDDVALIEAMVRSQGCPNCRGHTQWTDVDTGVFVRQSFGFLKSVNNGVVTLTRVFTVNEWNHECDVRGYPHLKIDFANAREIVIDGDD